LRLAHLRSKSWRESDAGLFLQAARRLALYERLYRLEVEKIYPLGFVRTGTGRLRALAKRLKDPKEKLFIPPGAKSTGRPRGDQFALGVRNLMLICESGLRDTRKETATRSARGKLQRKRTTIDLPKDVVGAITATLMIAFPGSFKRHVNPTRNVKNAF